MLQIEISAMVMAKKARYEYLLLIAFASGCASAQDRFCDLIAPDSYLLVAAAGCPTMQLSFDYDAAADFSSLESYDWMPAQERPSGDSGSGQDTQWYGWVTDAIDEKLAERGFRIDRAAADFLVSYEVPVENQGTLTLTFVQPRSRNLIWRGQLTDRARPASNRAAWGERIRAAIDGLLEQFPPSN